MARYAKTAAALVVLVGMWEVLVRAFHIPSFILPPPSAIVLEMGRSWESLARHATVTTYEILLGFIVGACLGLIIAVAIVASKTLEEVLYPVIVFSQVVPKIAIAPLLIVWLGYGLLPKVVIAFLISFFPVVIDSVTGLRAVEEDLVHLVQGLGATRWQVFAKIRFPNALPFIFSGLKISITLAVVGAIIGEFVGANKGLGYLILLGSAHLQTHLLFAAVVVLALLGVVLFTLVRVAERLVLPWKTVTETELVGTL